MVRVVLLGVIAAVAAAVGWLLKNEKLPGIFTVALAFVGGAGLVAGFWAAGVWAALYFSGDADAETAASVAVLVPVFGAGFFGWLESLPQKDRTKVLDALRGGR